MEINDKELVHLVRLALDGNRADVAALTRRIARRMAADSPETAAALAKLAKRSEKELARGGKQVAHMPVDLESRLELARVENGVEMASTPLWSSTVEAGLRQVVAERENAEALAHADLQPARSLLFVGPPGVGKTLSARWLAGQLKVPLVTLDLAAVMSSFLGRTGNNLRNVLDYSKSTNCVLLLDEFDAIAKRRDDAVEVGELKRLVTVLLQEIDNWPTTGILIAATNHPELLDPAVWRRFDLVLDFGLPTADQVAQFVTGLLKDESGSIAAAAAVAMQGMSFSDIERELLRGKRRAVLAGKPMHDILTEIVTARLDAMTKKQRIAVAVELEKAIGQRRANEITKVSRDTMRKGREQLNLEDDDA